MISIRYAYEYCLVRLRNRNTCSPHIFNREMYFNNLVAKTPKNCTWNIILNGVHGGKTYHII